MCTVLLTFWSTHPRSKSRMVPAGTTCTAYTFTRPVQSNVELTQYVLCNKCVLARFQSYPPPPHLPLMINYTWVRFKKAALLNCSSITSACSRSLNLRARNLFLISRKFPLPTSILKGSLMIANLESFWISCHLPYPWQTIPKYFHEKQ